MAFLLFFLRLFLLSIHYGSVDCDPVDRKDDKRLNRRIQPDAVDVTPQRPLEWGQINFIHSSDIHGWYEGHIKERNYRGDWGDYISFIKHMRHTADDLNVDLLVIDTGDLHDGAGLSDVTRPNGQESDKIFQMADFDLLTVGNHELVDPGVPNATHETLAKHYGDKYITSNVYLNDSSNNNQPILIGSQYRGFTTKHGLRIMAFGVFFDMYTPPSGTKVDLFKDMITKPWFTTILRKCEDFDLFVLIGHNPVRLNKKDTDNNSTLLNVTEAIQERCGAVPVQVFGGHSHIRDFMVYNENATALESGKYGDTVGWLAMTGIQAKNFTGSMAPQGVPNPHRPAKKINSLSTINGASITYPSSKISSEAELKYARRFLDWNRETFEFHTNTFDDTFDTPEGLNASHQITDLRKKYKLAQYYGCAPRSYCISCKPQGHEGNIYTLLKVALETIVVNQTWSGNSRLIFANKNGIRYDLAQGPFTYDDAFIVSPFNNFFKFIRGVPAAQAAKIKNITDFGCHKSQSENLPLDDSDWKPTLGHIEDYSEQKLLARHAKRQALGMLTPGYTTWDDFGNDGDDTQHSAIPSYRQSPSVQVNVTIPNNSDFYDVVFIDHMEKPIMSALKCIDKDNKFASEIYLPKNINTITLLPLYASKKWATPLENCTVGGWIG